MKCENCRCIIPETSDYCIYCGYETSKRRDATADNIRRESAGRSYSYPPYQGGWRSYPYVSGNEAALSNPSYTVYGESFFRGASDGVYQQEADNGTEWDFSVINEDGSLNLVKLLVYCAGLDIMLILLMLLLALAFMI